MAKTLVVLRWRRQVQDEYFVRLLISLPLLSNI
jgi:hypothetical protein